MTAARIARDTRTVLLGLLLWPFVMLYVSPRLAVRAYRIARRLVRKLAKPVALWLTKRALRRAEEQARHYESMRRLLVPMERYEHRRMVALTARRNEIQRW